MNEFLIGRQQILDKDLNVVAYEILCRNQNFDLTNPTDASTATDQVINDILLEIGLNTIVGDARAFVNFTTQNLLDKTPLNLPKDRIVIEILENVEITPHLITTLHEFSEQGYTLALDDFILTPEWLPLLKIADIIKLDIMQMPMHKTLALIEKLKKYNITLLAEKVETQEEFKILQQAGCTLFQGFFFNKPELIEGKRAEASQTDLLQLMAKVNQPGLSFDEINQIISQSPTLTYKLLQYINSAFFSLPNRVDSIPQATTLLGIQELKRWTNILMLTGMTSKPPAVLQIFLIRAKMCELLAKQFSENSETLFLVGLLSGLDTLLNIPLKTALNQLPLEQKILDAVLYKKGSAGKILDFVLRYERWDKSIYKDLINITNMSQIYLACIEWSEQILDYA